MVDTIPRRNSPSGYWSLSGTSQAIDIDQSREQVEGAERRELERARVKARNATKCAEQRIFLRTSETDEVIGTNGERRVCMKPTLDPGFLTNKAEE